MPPRKRLRALMEKLLKTKRKRTVEILKQAQQHYEAVVSAGSRNRPFGEITCIQRTVPGRWRFASERPKSRERTPWNIA